MMKNFGFKEIAREVREFGMVPEQHENISLRFKFLEQNCIAMLQSLLYLNGL